MGLFSYNNIRYYKQDYNIFTQKQVRAVFNNGCCKDEYKVDNASAVLFMNKSISILIYTLSRHTVVRSDAYLV